MSATTEQNIVNSRIQTSHQLFYATPGLVRQKTVMDVQSRIDLGVCVSLCVCACMCMVLTAELAILMNS